MQEIGERMRGAMVGLGLLLSRLVFRCSVGWPQGVPVAHDIADAWQALEMTLALLTLAR